MALRPVPYYQKTEPKWLWSQSSSSSGIAKWSISQQPQNGTKCNARSVWDVNIIWHRVRDGTLSRDDFGELVLGIRASLKATLLEADEYEIPTREKTPRAKTVRTCRQLLKVESAMWLFVTTVGVEPTNNAAERAIRPAVIGRRTSFGSQTKTGSVFVVRMLTVVTTLRSQKRNVLEFMTQAVVAARGGQTVPSLLPEATTCSDDSDSLKAA